MPCADHVSNWRVNLALLLSIIARHSKASTRAFHVPSMHRRVCVFNNKNAYSQLFCRKGTDQIPKGCQCVAFLSNDLIKLCPPLPSLTILPTKHIDVAQSGAQTYTSNYVPSAHKIHRLVAPTDANCCKTASRVGND